VGSEPYNSSEPVCLTFVRAAIKNLRKGA
jgi:hypothetical protein